MSKAIEVKGEAAAVAVLERAGAKAQDQTGSLSEASHVEAVHQGDWQNQTGALTKSLNEVKPDNDTLRYYSNVPYAHFVFYGTSHQDPRPPKIDTSKLIQEVVQRVANDIVGEH